METGFSQSLNFEVALEKSLNLFPLRWKLFRKLVNFENKFKFCKKPKYFYYI